MKIGVVGGVVLALVLVAGTGCITPPPGKSVPFTAQGSGHFEGPDGRDLSGTADGNVIGSGTIRASYSLAGAIAPPCPSKAGLVGQSVTLTAANGDTIEQQWSGTYCMSSTDVAHATETYTTNGGTGRYRNATGSGTVTFDADLRTITFTFDEDGTICCFQF